MIECAYSMCTNATEIWQKVVSDERNNANARYILREKGGEILTTGEVAGLGKRLYNIAHSGGTNEKLLTAFIARCMELWQIHIQNEAATADDIKKAKRKAATADSLKKRYMKVFAGFSDFDKINFARGAKVSAKGTCIDDWHFYAKSCKYPKIWRYLDITIPSKWDLEIIGGMATFTNKANNRVFWLQKYGRAKTDWALVEGWLIDGKHIEKRKGYTAANCLKKEAERLAALEASKKAAKVAAVNEIPELIINYDNITSMYGEEMTKVIKAHADEPVTFADSLRAGNCHPGTMNFKKRAEALCGANINTLPLCQVAELGCRFGVGLYVGLIIRKKYAI